MRKNRVAIFSLIIVFTLVISSNSLASGADRPEFKRLDFTRPSQARQAEYVPGEVLVQFKPGVAAGERSKVHEHLKTEFKQRISSLKLDVVKIDDKRSVAEVVSTYRSDPRVKLAQPNYIYRAAAVPNDTYYGDQYGLPKIQMPNAWSLADTTTTANTTAAVLDTGADFGHPDLATNLASADGWDFINNDDNASDDNGHGTHVAGIIAAVTNNGLGVAGVTWKYKVKILPVKVLNSAGSGNTTNVANGINWAVAKGAKVISLSLTAYSNSPNMDPTLAAAVDNAYNSGCVIVAAAGNLGTELGLGTQYVYPAGYETTVIAVSATDSSDHRAYFSNYGHFVDVCAPGYDVLSTYYLPSTGEHGYAWASGTSMSTPFVAAVAACLFSVNPGLTPAQVEQRLEAGCCDLGSPGQDRYYGRGRINTYASLTNGTTETAPAAPADYEPNDSSTTAQSFAAGHTLSAYLYSTGDVDWYKFTVYQPGAVKVTLDSPVDMDGMLDVYNSALTSVASQDIYGPWGTESAYISVTPGTYYVKISDYYGYASDLAYQLSIASDTVIKIGGTEKSRQELSSGDIWTPIYPGLMNGPVTVESAAQKLICSQRVLYQNSFNEVMGTREEDLGTKYYFTWYDYQSLGMNGNWILIGNPSTTSSVSAQVLIGGQYMGSYTIPPGGRVTPSYPGVMNGPVEIIATGKVFCSQRVLYKDSFNEVMGTRTEDLGTKYYFTWYDYQSLGMNGNWVLIGNPSITQTANVEIYVGGALSGSYTVSPQGRITPIYPGVMNGPVEVRSTNGVPVFCSQRVLYKDSFNEVMGTREEDLGTKYYFTWYDGIYMKNWLLVGNPSTTATANCQVYVGGSLAGSYSISPGGRVTPTYPGVMNGPVEVRSTNGVPVFCSQRVLYQDSFNEVMGTREEDLGSKYYFTWYDYQSLGMNGNWVLVSPL